VKVLGKMQIINTQRYLCYAAAVVDSKAASTTTSPDSRLGQFHKARLFVVDELDFRQLHYVRSGGFLHLGGSYATQAKDIPQPNFDNYCIQGAHDSILEGYVPYITDAVYQRYMGDDNCVIQAFTTAVGMPLGKNLGALGVMPSAFPTGHTIEMLRHKMRQSKGTALHAFFLRHEPQQAKQWAKVWEGPPRILICWCNVCDGSGKQHAMAIDTARRMLWLAPSNRKQEIPGECEGAWKVEGDDLLMDEDGWQCHMRENFHLLPPIKVWCVMVSTKRASFTAYKPPPQWEKMKIRSLKPSMAGKRRQDGSLVAEGGAIDFEFGLVAPSISGYPGIGVCE
jgi:hypothetical protein